MNRAAREVVIFAANSVADTRHDDNTTPALACRTPAPFHFCLAALKARRLRSAVQAPRAGESQLLLTACAPRCVCSCRGGAAGVAQPGRTARQHEVARGREAPQRAAPASRTHASRTTLPHSRLPLSEPATQVGSEGGEIDERLASSAKLIEAAKRGDVGAVRASLDGGADIESKDYDVVRRCACL